MGTPDLLSGFAGAILAVVLSKCVELFVFYLGRRSLYSAIYAECQYNIGIVNEMRDGMLRGATFKRMSVEFFKEMRLLAVQCHLDKVLLSRLSRLIVDLELYNREADCMFDEHAGSMAYAGKLGTDSIVITKNPIATDLSETVKAACVGVTGSLNGVIEVVREKLGEEDSDED